jgi:NAD(P)-dependent dehydrogenase (short-subunit alcohol dehydrogenase family)
MKIAITGHTSGIGKSLLDEFQCRQCQVVGFSRSTGHDITNDAIQQHIVDQLDTIDIFVNNAHAGLAQTELFTKIWNKWRMLPKRIVNIGSISTTFRQGPNDLPWQPLGRAHYAAEKAALEMAVNWAWNDHVSQCEAVLVKPGFVDTPRTNSGGSTFNMIDADDLAQYIVNAVLDQPFVVRELTIRARK